MGVTAEELSPGSMCSTRHGKRPRRELEITKEKDACVTTSTEKKRAKTKVSVDHGSSKKIDHSSSALFLPCHLSILKSLYETTPANLHRKKVLDDDENNTLIDEGKVDNQVWDLARQFIQKRRELKAYQQKAFRLQAIEEEARTVLKSLSSQKVNSSARPAPPFTSPNALRCNYPTSVTGGNVTLGLPAAAQTSSSPHRQHHPHAMMFSPLSPLFGGGSVLHHQPNHPSQTSSVFSSWALVTNLMAKKTAVTCHKGKCNTIHFRPLAHAVLKRVDRLKTRLSSLQANQKHRNHDKAMNILSVHKNLDMTQTSVNDSDESVESDSEEEEIVVVETKIRLWTMLDDSIQQVRVLV